MRKLALAAGLILLGLPLVCCASSPMKRAVESGDAAAVAALLDQGADLNGTIGQADLTPLKLAVNARKPAVAKLLLERGADVNVRRNGTSALSLASVNGDLPMVELLLSKGAEATAREILWAKGPDRDAIVALLKAASARQAAASAAAAKAESPESAPESDADVPTYKAGERPDDFALVVAVEKPMDGPEARFAERDAAAMRRHLIALGVPERNVLMLTGKQAGRAGLEKYLERWLPNNVSENSRLFFYFAGNGASNPATGRAYLLPWDGDAGLLEATGYPLSRLYQKLGAMKTRGTWAVIDAGFCGVGGRTAAAPGVQSPSSKLDVSARDVGASVVLLAVSAGEAAASLDAQKHGLLTYFVLKGLDDGAAGPGGAVTVKRLFESARAKVIEAAAAQGLKQTPQLLTGTLGESDLRLR